MEDASGKFGRVDIGNGTHGVRAGAWDLSGLPAGIKVSDLLYLYSMVSEGRRGAQGIVFNRLCKILLRATKAWYA